MQAISIEGLKQSLQTDYILNVIPTLSFHYSDHFLVEDACMQYELNVYKHSHKNN